MMLPVTGPKSTLMEDLADLGLVDGKPKNSSQEGLAEAELSKDNKKGSGYAKPDAKGGDYAGPDDGKETSDKAGPGWSEGDYMLNVGDEAAGTRKNVPVRQGGVDRTSVGPDAQNPAKNEEEEEEGETVAETTNSKMVPDFLIPSEDEVAEAEEQDAADAEKAKLDRAWDVVRSYFSEDDDGLNEAGLRGVINAMGYALNVAVEDVANLTAENARLTEAVDELTGLLQEAEHEMDASRKDDDDEDKDDDDDEKKQSADYADYMKLRKKEKKEESAPASNLSESVELTSLLQELRSIGSDDRPTRAVDKQSALIEQFEQVRNESREVCNKIIDVIAEDQGLQEGQQPDLDEDDARVQIAQHFDSIAEDADGYLGRLSEGNVPFKVAEADLGKLKSDMEKGFTAMKSVE